MSTYKAIATTQLGVVDIIEIPTSEPGDDELLIKVEYSSLMPLDTYMSDLGFFVEQYPTVLGLSASGTVVKLGSGIDDLDVGDRVAAFTFKYSSNKGMQQYTVQPRVVCSKIPDTLSFAEAAAIPDNLVTAFYTLFSQLHLPIPPSFPAPVPPPNAFAPILVYGAGSNAGQYMVQLLSSAGYKKIIVTASASNHAMLRSLGATDAVDYKSPTLKSEVAQAVGGENILNLAVDCIATETTLAFIAQVISPKGTVGILLPTKKGSKMTVSNASDFRVTTPEDNGPFAKTVTLIGVVTARYLDADPYLKENLMPKIVPSLLADGIIKPSRIRLMNQGSFKERVDQGLDLLRNSKTSGEKVIVQVP